MSWHDTKQAAVDPDNPGATEQIPFSEWNTMVTYLKDKINNKTVDLTGLLDDMIMVYDLPNDKFVFEAKSTTAALNDLTDVVISGVPADNEVLAYNTATSKFINQTAAEALLATTTQLTTLETAAVLNADYNATTFMYALADDTPLPKTPAEVLAILSGTATAEFLFNTQKIGGIVDPTTAQQASTKNYDDTHLFTKGVTTSFTNGYVPVYRTASGKFEMEAQGGGLWTSLSDTPAAVTASQVVRGNAGGTEIEFSGVAETDYLLKTGARAMTGNLDMGDHTIIGIDELKAYDSFGMNIRDSVGNSMAWLGYDNANHFFRKIDLNGTDIDDIGKLIYNASTERTIAAGVVTITQSYHTIDTESDAATDDLNTINDGTTGQALIICAANAARTVVAKDGVGNLRLEGDMSLDNSEDTLSLLFDGTNWLETSRSNNGA